MRDTFHHNGRGYRLELLPEDCSETPWHWADGHGPVSEPRRHHGSNPPKAPGERILYRERGYYRTYDMQEATRIAKRDGWGLNPADEAKLAQSLGRAPTRNEIVREAVERDFQHLRAWCNDEWHYVTVHIIHDESGEDEYLGMVEDSDDAYVMESARELASEIAYRLDEEMAADIAASRPDLAPSYHAEG